MKELVLLTQRTQLLKKLLQIADVDEKALKKQIKIICSNAGVEYNPPRGREGQQKKAKPHSSAIRYALSILMGIHLNCEEGGVVLDDSGRLLSNEVIDRLIYSYHRYLQVQDSLGDPRVINFELFVTSWESLQIGDASTAICVNCGSSHFKNNSDIEHSCPVCTSLKLAVKPSNFPEAENFYSFPGAKLDAMKGRLVG